MINKTLRSNVLGCNGNVIAAVDPDGQIIRGEKAGPPFGVGLIRNIPVRRGPVGVDLSGRGECSFLTEHGFIITQRSGRISAPGHGSGLSAPWQEWSSCTKCQTSHCSGNGWQGEPTIQCGWKRGRCSIWKMATRDVLVEKQKYKIGGCLCHPNPH